MCSSTLLVATFTRSKTDVQASLTQPSPIRQPAQTRQVTSGVSLAMRNTSKDPTFTTGIPDWFSPKQLWLLESAAMEVQRFVMIACLIAGLVAVNVHADTSAGVLGRPSRRLLQEYVVVDAITDFASGVSGDVVTSGAESETGPADTAVARTASRDGTIVSVENNPVFNVPGSGNAENDITVKPEIINVSDGSTVVFLPFSKWPFPVATAWTKLLKKRIKNMP
ncbi:hypothetical protein BSKO_10527 [Bryopsis sp. KO-2023]|nr:hypothetical protein BSKO_10527 [Bryopsis sp. KO-2023]